MKVSAKAILYAVPIVIAGVVAFHNSFSGPFVFDDIWSIRDNPTLRQIWPLSGVLDPIPGALTVSGRPILNLSFAIDHAFFGTDVFGYHIVNLVIHLLAGLALFGVLRRTLASRALESFAGTTAAPLAALIAALWVVHPLQTESVTYIVQRAESLMGFFFLFTLYAVIRGTEARRGWPWYAAAVLTCALGMGTKEVMALAPLVVLLYDRTFLAGSFGQTWRQRKYLYLSLAATLGIFAWLLLETGNRDGTAGFEIAVSPIAYALTQFQAVARYLWLSLWPHPLVFDYGVFEVHRAMEVVPYALVILALLAATLWGFIRNRAWAFLGLWFFLILAPTSSFLPSSRQTMSEHRMYLPLAAVLALVVLGVYFLSKRKLWHTITLGAAWAIALCVVTIDRNKDYQSDYALYASAAAAQPNNAYAQFGLGTALLQRQQTEEALRHLDIALSLKSDDKSFHLNRADALLKLGRPEEAIPEFEAAFRLGSVPPEILWNYASTLASVKQYERAVIAYEMLLQHQPGNPAAERALLETRKLAQPQ